MSIKNKESQNDTVMRDSKGNSAQPGFDGNHSEEKREYELNQEGLEEVMKKYDRESNVRIWTGRPGLVVKAILIGFSVFCIWVTLFATFLEEIRLTSFMGLIVLMGFLYYPADKAHNRPNHIPWYDVIGMILGAGAFFYYTFSAQ